MDTNQTIPQIPAKFYQRSALWSALLIATALSYFFGAGVLNSLLWLKADLPVLAKLALSLPLFALAGQGLHLAGFVGHEGLHFNLSKSRHLSMWLGTIVSSISVLFIQMGMTLDHWTHHSHCNTEKDPDIQLFGRYNSLLSRMFLARPAANRLYVRRALRMMMGAPLDPSIARIVFPLSRQAMRRYCALNFLCSAAWAALYLSIAWWDWRIFLIGFVVPLLVVDVLSGLRPYVEHMGLRSGNWLDSRSRIARFWTILDFGANLHLEHHLYPKVPQWLLPALHRHLRQAGAFAEQTNLEDFVIRPYRRAVGPYRLPDGVELSD